MSDKVRWGILSTGRIAAAFARALPHSETGHLQAVGSRSMESANAFADEHNIPTRHGSYDDLLADPSVDAVYIATPHPFHPRWAIRAAEAGKHILCEKPIALNARDAEAIIEAAKRNDVFLMEAFMYRCNPLTAKVVELLKSGVIGDVRLVRATFSFQGPHDTEGRLLNNRLGGGGILDVGCYTTSMSRLIAGAAAGKPFEDPVEVKGVGHLSEEGTDEWAAAVLNFPGGIVAQCATGVQLRQDADVVVYGSDGKLTIPTPWFATGREGGTGRILISRNAGEDETVEVSGGWLYAIEADTVARYIDNRQADSPAMSWADTLGNMRTLDRWREEVGVVYELEGPAGYTEPLDGNPLCVRDNARMPTGSLDGLEKNVSRLVLGAMPFTTLAAGANMYDEFFARGGNCFDTAYVYSGGASETALGDWIEARDIREEIAVLVKGAHTPLCSPEHMKSQLTESLQRMRLDYADLYFLHRDNPDIPVEEWVDALSAEVDAGRIRVYGGSNWSPERIRAANAYAEQAGKHGFSAVSNNFSLARMLSPVWDGCIASSDPEIRKWHEDGQIPLFAWSSQAQGFFVPGIAAPEKQDDPLMVRCWYSDENFERQRRARELAEKKGTSQIAVALAYVLKQAFPTYALIGPRSLAELRTSCDALDVELTDADAAWLDLREA